MGQTRVKGEVVSKVEEFQRKAEAVLQAHSNGVERGLYQDASGRLIEVSSIGPNVEFIPQGGGFLRSMSRADFEKNFVPATVPAFERATITADWLPEGVNLPAYSNGLAWNGWAMPYFDRETAMRLVEIMPEIRYDEQHDAFIAHDETSGEDDVFAGVSIQVEGEAVTVYPIGAGSWCWETSDEDEQSADTRPKMRL
ncbi:hypothetical protein BVER_01709 [Candidatus Burkholderia verschuerenii]|uniref:Uncharacterized protein n=1 Tax=Candidatus Burkholderia verschuerenii TaxID=242163 RepID=A0A0L0MJ08_9BURK|nr:hypothetical protein BVER_01709 [Candidatus Burkholderia verschuerenii]